MVKVVWLGHETLSRDILPYVHTLKHLGVNDIDIHYDDDIYSTISYTPHEVNEEILILHHHEDPSYGEGSWGWNPPTEIKNLSYEQLLPLIRPNTTIILLHQDSRQAIDPRIKELKNVYIENTYSQAMNRIITDCINANEIQIQDVSLPINGPVILPSGQSLSSLPLVKRIVFIRHAQRLDEVDSQWADMAERPQDTPLTSMGIQQSRYLGEWISQQAWYPEINSFFVSPFVRTVQTAHFALESLNSASTVPLTVPLNIEYGLSEGAAWMSNNNKCRTPWHLKAADLYCISTHINLSYQAVKIPEFHEGPVYPGRPVEKELWYDRCAQTIWRLVRMSEYSDKTIVLVTHAGCVGLLVHSLSGRALPMVGHTAVTSLIWNGQTGKYDIETKEDGNEIFVQQDHLPMDMRTGTW